jgi:hypothetical protein
MAQQYLPLPAYPSGTIEAFLSLTPLELPPPLPLPTNLFSVADPGACDSPLHQRRQRLRRLTIVSATSSLHARLRGVKVSWFFVVMQLSLLPAARVSRSVCVKVRGFCGVRGVKVRGFGGVLQLSIISVDWVSRSGGSVVFGVSMSGGQVGVKVRGFCPGVLFCSGC